jgi:hypothetical protein
MLFYKDLQTLQHECCAYDMKIYLGKDRQDATQTVTARSLTGIVERVGHKLYMGSFFSSPDLMLSTQEVSTAVGCIQNHK